MADFDKFCTTGEPEIAPGNTSALPNVKTLGIKWLMTEDHFSYGNYEYDSSTKWTKTSILSQAPRLYDPTGFLTPLCIKPKLILQQIWSLLYGWKDVIDPSSEEAREWDKWLRDVLPNLHKIKIPRVLIPGLDKDIARVQLHTFCDASAIAFGCVSYTRVLYRDGSVYTNIIQSKNRVKSRKVSINVF